MRLRELLGKLRLRRSNSGVSPREVTQQRAVPDETRSRPHRTIATTIGGIVVVIVLALTAAGGTYAFLNAQATTPGVTISAGTATLAVSGSPVSLAGLYPGLTVRGSVVVSNTGETPLLLSASSLTGPATFTSLSQNLTVSVFVADSSAACTAGTVSSGTTAASGTFASFAGGSLSKTLPVSGSARICLAVALSGSAPSGAQGASASFSLGLTGVQQ